MESISKRTGKKFTGKFASTAVRLGLATPASDEEEVDLKQVKKTPKKTSKLKEKPEKTSPKDKTIVVPDQVRVMIKKTKK